MTQACMLPPPRRDDIYTVDAIEACEWSRLYADRFNELPFDCEEERRFKRVRRAALKHIEDKDKALALANDFLQVVPSLGADECPQQWTIQRMLSLATGFPEWSDLLAITACKCAVDMVEAWRS